MKVTFTRSGGFLGLTYKVELDTELLESEKAKELEDLVSKINITSLTSITDTVRDGYLYRIDIEDEDSKITAVYDSGALYNSERDIVPLIDYLEDRIDQSNIIPHAKTMLIRLTSETEDLFDDIEGKTFIGSRDSLSESIKELEDEINEELPWGWEISEIEEEKGNQVPLHLQYYSCIEGDFCDEECGISEWLYAYIFKE